MISNWLRIIMILAVFAGQALADGSVEKRDSAEEPGRDDMKIIAVMDVLQLMDLVDSMDMIKDMDVLIEEEQNENQD
jgi:hypothetical protein